MRKSDDEIKRVMSPQEARSKLFGVKKYSEFNVNTKKGEYF